MAHKCGIRLSITPIICLHLAQMGFDLLLDATHIQSSNFEKLLDL